MAGKTKTNQNKNQGTVSNINLFELAVLCKKIGGKKLFSYAGSKMNFFEYFQEVFEKNGGTIEVGTYIEAFAGSLAALIINLQFVKAKKVVINDLNKRIINLYRHIQINPELVFEVFERIENHYQSLIPVDSPSVRIYPKDRREEIAKCPEFYKHIRKEMNKDQLDYFHAGLTLWVLNHQFNGMYNENKKGEFNVSFNWSTQKLNTEAIKDTLFKLHKLFNSNETEFVFETLDVDSLISKYNDHDTFIYLDPPYIDTKIQYNQKRVKQENTFMNPKTHIDMLDSCSKYKYVMYSNNDHKDFKKYFGKNFVNFDRKHSIATKKSKKSKKEILGFKVNEVVNNVDYQPVETEVLTGTDAVINTASICSGCGAPEEALKQAGISHNNVFMCEWNDEVSNVYKMNHTSENYFKDFYKVDWRRVEDIKYHIMFISTPCQSFSIGGKRKGLDDLRGDLFIDSLRQVRKMNIDRIIQENVKGIISSGKHYSKIQTKEGEIIELNYIPKEKDLKKEGWTIIESQKNKYVYESQINKGQKIGRTLKLIEDIILSEFNDYNCYWTVLNSSDFNLPHNRERFFLVMIKKELDLGFRFPQTQELKITMEDLLENNVNQKYHIVGRKIETVAPKKLSRKNQLVEYGKIFNKNGTESKYRSGSVVHYPVISPCLTTSGHTKIFHQNVVRNLTPKEQMRLQGFSEDFKLPFENYELSSHLMGNTISVPVIKEIIKEVLFMNTPVNNLNYEVLKNVS